MKICKNKKCISFGIAGFGEDKFCYECGVELQEQEKCVCGKTITVFSKFCPKCGIELVKQLTNYEKEMMH